MLSEHTVASMSRIGSGDEEEEISCTNSCGIVNTGYVVFLPVLDLIQFNHFRLSCAFVPCWKISPNLVP